MTRPQDTGAGPERTSKVAGDGAQRLPDVSPTYPRRVDAWVTSDGCLHDSEFAAGLRQRNLDGAKMATAALESGQSLGAALRVGGFLLADTHPELDEVTESTKLIISHWQCRDQPGYRPRSVDREGYVFVFGDAGSWSGPYGSRCSPRDVAMYWTNTKRRSGGAL